MGIDPLLYSVVSEICTDWSFCLKNNSNAWYDLTAVFTIQPQRFGDSRKEFIFSQRCLEPT